MSALCSENGIDTVRFRWRTDHDTYLGFLRRPTGVIQGYRGEVFDQTELGRLGAYPDGMVYFEGRASALVFEDRTDHSLMPAADLHLAEQVARKLAISNGADIGSEPARLGRVDLAGELLFSDPSEGSAFLHSLACIDAPWCKSRADGRKGDHIETVSFHGTSGSTIYLRAYDKGVESGSAPPGHRIRVERQKRYRKTREVTVDEFELLDLRDLFVGREFAQLAELPSAVVVDLPGAISEVLRADITAQMKERLVGFLVVGRNIDYDKMTRWRRASKLRELGIFVDPAMVGRLEVPVGRYLQALASAWSTAA